jgi:hypothetical protein
MALSYFRYRIQAGAARYGRGSIHGSRNLSFPRFEPLCEKPFDNALERRPRAAAD